MSTFSNNETVRVITYARLRGTPGYKDKPQTDTKVVLAPGAIATIRGESQILDGLRWWLVASDSYVGWVAESDPDGNTMLAGGNQATWDRSIEFVLRWEGRFSSDRNDKGNWTGGAVGRGEFKGTKFGISAASFPNLAIANLTIEEAKGIYFKKYWEASGANNLDWPLCLMHLDAAVNCGVYQAGQLLAKSGEDFLQYGEARKDFYRSLDDFSRYGVAWLRRVDDILSQGGQSRSISQGNSMPTKAELYMTIANAFTALATLEAGSVVSTPTGPVDPTPTSETFRRQGSWVTPLGLRVKRIVDRPDAPLRRAAVLYVVKDIFTTANGSWDPSGQPGSIDAWARDAYLRANSDPMCIQAGGADHHLFGMVLGLDGKPIKNQAFQFWSDGFEKLGDPGYSLTVVSAQDASGWVNFPVSKGSGYNTAIESGPWCWCPAGASEVITGGGMPDGHHVSTFVVWEAVKISD